MPNCRKVRKINKRKVVNKHSKWPSEGGNKVVCMEQTDNYYAPEPQITVCGKIPLTMRYASLALRTLFRNTSSTIVSHPQSSHCWLIREDQFSPMLLKYLLPMYFLYCSILLKELQRSSGARSAPCGAPWVSKSTHPRKSGNHVTVRRPPVPSHHRATNVQSHTFWWIACLSHTIL